MNNIIENTAKKMEQDKVEKFSQCLFELNEEGKLENQLTLEMAKSDERLKFLGDFIEEIMRTAVDGEGFDNVVEAVVKAETVKEFDVEAARNSGWPENWPMSFAVNEAVMAKIA